MLAPSHPRGDSQSIRGGYRGKGQRPYCTYYNRWGHIRDRCYQLHGRPPRTAHVAQSFDQPPSPSQGVTATPGKYEEFLRLTHAAKSISIASVTRPVMPLPILHTLLVHGFSIPAHLIICLVIRISFLPLLSLHPYL